jgi:hypothetical protein
MTPRKQKRRLCGTALRKLRLTLAYHLAAFPAIVLEKPYWFWEARRGHLADLIENERDVDNEQ